MCEGERLWFTAGGQKLVRKNGVKNGYYYYHYYYVCVQGWAAKCKPCTGYGVERGSGLTGLSREYMASIQDSTELCICVGVCT